MRNIIIGVVIVLALGGGAYAISQKDSSKKADDNSGTSSQNSPSKTSSDTSQSSSASSPLNVTVTANDTSASPDTINAVKGQTVNLTFKVESEGTYHGGLEFKSDDVNSDSIAPGQSKTVTFTADKSFKFTPYWYQSGVKKDYLVTVDVK